MKSKFLGTKEKTVLEQMAKEKEKKKHDFVALIDWLMHCQLPTIYKLISEQLIHQKTTNIKKMMLPLVAGHQIHILNQEIEILDTYYKSKKWALEIRMCISRSTKIATNQFRPHINHHSKNNGGGIH
jgi:hypothetical protein